MQLEAGILGSNGNFTWQAYARTWAPPADVFDDDVARFFSPYAESKSAIFLVALGRCAKQRP